MLNVELFLKFSDRAHWESGGTLLTASNYRITDNNNSNLHQEVTHISNGIALLILMADFSRCNYCLKNSFTGNMAHNPQIAMNEMLRHLNLPLLCRRMVANDGNCFYDREVFNKALDL